METQAPSNDGEAPLDPEPSPEESLEARHTRELSQSLDALEDTVETGILHVLEKALPFVLGVFVACAGAYVVGRRVRNRAKRRRAARSL